MDNLKIRESLALLDKAMQLMGKEGVINSNIKYYTPPLIKVNNRLFDTSYYGYFPNGRGKNQLIKSVFGNEAIEGLGYICMGILSSLGYNQHKKISAKDLKSILGNKYILILETAEKNGLIKLRKTETEYHGSKRPCYHTEIAVNGRRGSFKRRKIQNEIAVQRLDKFYLKKLSQTSSEAFLKTHRDLKELVLLGEGNEYVNDGLQFGFFIPKVDAFGFRIHSYLTNLKKEQRCMLRNIHDLDEPLVEVDVSQSHAHLTFKAILTKPELIAYALKDETLLRVFHDVLYEYRINDAFLIDLELSLDNRTFYSEFFLCLLEDSLEDWRGFILKKIIEDDPNSKVFTDYDMSKIAFMYVINGGAKPILDALSSNERYDGFRSLVLAVQNIRIPHDCADIKGVEDYAPYKNFAMILQRIESKAMQTAYAFLKDVWGILLHDAIVCKHCDRYKVKQAIIDAYLALDLGYPIVKFK